MAKKRTGRTMANDLYDHMMSGLEGKLEDAQLLERLEAMAKAADFDGCFTIERYRDEWRVAIGVAELDHHSFCLYDGKTLAEAAQKALDDECRRSRARPV
jgi:ATP-dependent protease HslVU (ClpYQ) peptidase subunit